MSQVLPSCKTTTYESSNPAAKKAGIASGFANLLQKGKDSGRRGDQSSAHFSSNHSQERVFNSAATSRPSNRLSCVNSSRQSQNDMEDIKQKLRNPLLKRKEPEVIAKEFLAKYHEKTSQEIADTYLTVNQMLKELN